MEDNTQLKGRIHYNVNLLKYYITRDRASDLGIHSNLTQDSIIKFICVCGEESSKKFMYIVRASGAFCKKCSEKNRRERITKTNMQKYGCAIATQNKDISAKTKKTCIERYGVENPAQKIEFREKMKQTMMKTYGTEYALQNTVFKDKYKETLKERYGVTVPYHSEELKNRGAETCKKIYGVENPFQNDVVKQKIIQTNILKYGVEHPSQNNEIMLKTQANAKKYKNYTMPSGAIRKVQGYEPFALAELIKVFSEDQIKTDRRDVPRVKYTIDDKERYYFPDIYIPDEKKIIEVKSTWTYKCKSDSILHKKEATEHLGYLYEIWVFDANGNRVSVEDT